MLYVTPTMAPNNVDPKNTKAREAQSLVELEQVFIYKLLQEMRKTVDKTGLLGNSSQERFYEEMLDDVMAKDMAASKQFGMASAMQAGLDRMAAKAAVPSENRYSEGIPLNKRPEITVNRNPVSGIPLDKKSLGIPLNKRAPIPLKQLSNPQTIKSTPNNADTTSRNAVATASLAASSLGLMK
jgi:Rod binding domain-containing protein